MHSGDKGCALGKDAGVEFAFLIVLLAVTVLAGTAIAERIGIPAPLLLIAVGVGGAYLPFVPEVHLEPDVVLLGLLPPLLYAAALQTSLVDFNANRRPILLLSVGLVVFTTAGVGVVVHALLPGIGWAPALAIGAVVAPPDAVAATAIGRKIGLPRRLVTILEGESLLNDATALVALRTALAATLGGVALLDVGVDFVRAAGGGVLVGLAVFLIVAAVRKKITDAVFDTGVSLVTPFAAYLVAEELHASGVIAVVVAGLLLGHKAAILQSAQSRMAETTNWRTISFVLENTVFLLIGLQAAWIVGDAADSDLGWGRIGLVCATALVAVIVLRLAWVFPVRYLLVRPGPDRDTGKPPPWTYTFLLGWAGMRGVVTLAAAFVIPEGTPYREVLLLIALTVVAGTLFLQGLTLPWLARRLRVPSPDPAEDALARATLLQQASKAGLARLDELDYDDLHGVSDLIRQRIDQRNFAAWERLSTVADQETPSELYARVRLEMIEAERLRVLEIRDGGTVPADIVRNVLAMLDIEESVLDVSSRERARVVAASERGVRRLGALCAHLEASPVVATDATACEDCLVEGTVWVALRQCLACGHVGCCDSSTRQHATAHFESSGHPVIQSAEPGEDWRWCYLDHVTG